MNTLETPLGPVRVAAHDGQLTGLWFRGQKHEHAPSHDERTSPVVMQRVRDWLEAYFAGSTSTMPALAPRGTPFQQRVWDALMRIPPGKTLSYGELAATIGAVQSTRAVAAAVGRNPISLMIPCHRVVGADGKLTGYAGGVGRKQALLSLESRRDWPWQRVVAAYKPQYPNPIAVEVGEPVRFIDRADDGEFPGWKWAEAGDGRAGWVPREWFRESPTQVRAARAYSARELEVQPGDRIIAAEHFGGWVVAIREDGTAGWIPQAVIAADAG